MLPHSWAIFNDSRKTSSESMFYRYFIITELKLKMSGDISGLESLYKKAGYSQTRINDSIFRFKNTTGLDEASIIGSLLIERIIGKCGTLDELLLIVGQGLNDRVICTYF